MVVGKRFCRRVGGVVAIALLVGSFVGQLAMADESGEAVTRAIDAFAVQWDDQAWLEGNARRSGYIRPANDDSWKARMQALQTLVAMGQSAVGPLVEVLRDGEPAERILAAQALGYLAPHVPHEVLLRAIREDSDPAVRLYAVDSLGMQGGENVVESLDAALAEERNGDVLKHAGYVTARAGKGLDAQVSKRLVDWDLSRAGTAIVGQAAPDFRLTTITGEAIQLSQFRGKKAVVLVFLYGDT